MQMQQKQHPLQLTNVPVGVVLPFTGDEPPYGFLLCDGRELPINQYVELFGVIGTKFGGDGVTTFGLPFEFRVGTVMSSSLISLKNPLGGLTNVKTIIKH